MNKPVGIIISNYNYGEYVIEALKSALNQTYYNKKIILIDDGSDDNSLNKIQQYFSKKPDSMILTNMNEPYYNGMATIIEYQEHNTTVIHIKNSGASTARNVGLWHIWDSVDYFCILDADDYMHPNKVEKLIHYAENHDLVGVVYADYVINRSLYKKIEHKQPYSLDKLYHECIIHSGALIKKHYLNQVILENKEIYDSKLHGPLSQGFIGCTEDYDLWLRLATKCMIVHIPEVLTTVNEMGKNQSMKMTGDIFNKNMQIIASRNNGNNSN